MNNEDKPQINKFAGNIKKSLIDYKERFIALKEGALGRGKMLFSRQKDRNTSKALLDKNINTNFKNSISIIRNIHSKIKFRCIRFVGTTKHRYNLFYELKYLKFKENVLLVILERLKNAYNNRLTINEIKFRCVRFVGTTKHKYNLFYELKYLKYKENLFNIYNRLIGFICCYKKRFALGATAVVLLISSLFVYNNVVGYKVMFNGQEIGIVKDQSMINKALGVVNRELSGWYDTNVVFEQDVKFEKTVIQKDQLLATVDDCKNAVYFTEIDLSVQGAVITIEGEEVVVLSSVEEAKQVMEGVLNPFVAENSKEKLLEQPVIEEEYVIEEKLVDYASIKEVSKAISFISQGTDEIQKYKVKTGDTSWDIAVNRGININDLEAANPDKDITKLHDGDVLQLTVAKPYLTVKTVKEVKIDEKIKYGTTYKDDSSLYVGKTKVISEGIYGINQVTAKITYDNGEEINREIVSEKIIKEPTDEVVAKGTKPLPPAQGTGRFMMPTSGRVTAINKPGSHAGGRAVDIASRIGTAIYASDSGVVTTASYKSNGYGNCIIIDHGNGYSTLYGHLSSIGVSVGDRVTRGQYIGGMGSTGNSSGSHLHFEVRYNGARQKITNYFSYLAKGRHVSP